MRAHRVVHRVIMTLALSGACCLAAPVYADVSTTLQFFGSVQPDLTYEKNDPRIVSDSKSRDDAIARATAEAAADIGTGELKARATGQKFLSGESEIAARAVARAMDTLTIDGPGTDAIPVSFQMAVDGDLFVPAAANGTGQAVALVQGVLGIVGASEFATLQWRRAYDAGGAVVTDSLTGLGDWLGAAPVAGTTNHFDLLLQYDADIVPGTPFDFESELRAIVGMRGPIGSDAISDFGNTAKFTIILPQSYTFTSQSGLFLAGPVPEPQTWALLGVGLLGVGMYAKRRKQGSGSA